LWLQVLYKYAAAFHCSSYVQSAQAKAEEEYAAIFAELAEARQQIDALKKQVHAPECKASKPGSGRSKGKNFADVYDGNPPPPSPDGPVCCEHCKGVIDSQVETLTQVQKLLKSF
jgi:hypothetical protein